MEPGAGLQALEGPACLQACVPSIRVESVSSPYFWARHQVPMTRKSFLSRTWTSSQCLLLRDRLWPAGTQSPLRSSQGSTSGQRPPDMLGAVGAPIGSYWYNQTTADASPPEVSEARFSIYLKLKTMAFDGTVDMKHERNRKLCDF